jgi:hypothetical protein
VVARTISSGPSTPNCIRCTRLCGAELYVKRSMAPVLRLLRPAVARCCTGGTPHWVFCGLINFTERKFKAAMGSLRRGTWGLCTRAARAALSGRTGGHVWVDMPALGWGTGQGFRSAGGIAGQTWGVRGFASAGGSGDGGNESPVAEQPAAEEGEGEEQQAGASTGRVWACCALR